VAWAYIYKSVVGHFTAHRFSWINGCPITAEQHRNNCGENLTTWLSLLEEWREVDTSAQRINRSLTRWFETCVKSPYIRAPLRLLCSPSTSNSFWSPAFKKIDPMINYALCPRTVHSLFLSASPSFFGFSTCWSNCEPSAAPVIFVLFELRTTANHQIHSEWGPWTAALPQIERLEIRYKENLAGNNSMYLKVTGSASSSFVHPDVSVASKATAKLLNTSVTTNYSSCYTLYVILFYSSAIIFICHNFRRQSAVAYCEIQVWIRSVSCLPERSGGASCFE
jgi:hypothetical protein